MSAPAVALRSRHRLRRCGAALSLTLLLAACADMNPHSGQDPGPPVARHYQDSIVLNGRLSILYTQRNQPQSLYGSFTWSQQADHTQLSLLSPLGQTLAVIDIRPGIAVLTQPGKAPLAAADVDVLTAQALGWPLPVSGLRDWLQGFGHDLNGNPFVAHPANGPHRFLTQDGWTLTYGDWQDGEANSIRNHPKRIDLTRQTQQAGAVSIRIVIVEWQTRDMSTVTP